ncbi:MAG: M67 family metallopeptidase [Oscillospiraceae bacterium]|jgi:proteasome lid subunit RPN8/RPN11|nr:M67 family metallopeptidase [Oscillospiraceae bacterium]
MLILTRKIDAQIRTAGEDGYPNECCGALFGEADGDTRTVSEIFPIANARESDEQYHRFVITPEDFMRAELEARRQGLDVVGIYHSHPDHPAEPSEYDREHALPFYSYIIVSVEKGTSENLTSWELSADREKFTREVISWL